MFKNLLISVLVVGLSIGSISAIAASIESHPDTANVISATNNVENEAVLLQVSDKSSHQASVSSQPQIQSAENNESTLSAGWLFAVALLWFVILSNRRGV